ncbi:hypothetical protein Tco_0617476, partial [Tanacetum coccineum]
LISWQCKKPTVVAASSTKAEYVVAASCCRQIGDDIGDNVWASAGNYFVYAVGELLVIHHTINGNQFTMSNRQQRIRYSRANDNCEKKTKRELVRIKVDDGNAFWNEIGVDAARHTLTTASIKLVLPGISYYCWFWQTATARTLDNGEIEISAIIDGKAMIVTEASIRRHLKLEDSDGISNLATTEIFEQLALMGSKKTTWE